MLYTYRKQVFTIVFLSSSLFLNAITTDDGIEITREMITAPVEKISEFYSDVDKSDSDVYKTSVNDGSECGGYLQVFKRLNGPRKDLVLGLLITNQETRGIRFGRDGSQHEAVISSIACQHEIKGANGIELFKLLKQIYDEKH